MGEMTETKTVTKYDRCGDNLRWEEQAGTMTTLYTQDSSG